MKQQNTTFKGRMQRLVARTTNLIARMIPPGIAFFVLVVHSKRAAQIINHLGGVTDQTYNRTGMDLTGVAVGAEMALESRLLEWLNLGTQESAAICLRGIAEQSIISRTVGAQHGQQCGGGIDPSKPPVVGH